MAAIQEHIPYALEGLRLCQADVIAKLEAIRLLLVQIESNTRKGKP